MPNSLSSSCGSISKETNKGPAAQQHGSSAQTLTTTFTVSTSPSSREAQQTVQPVIIAQKGKREQSEDMTGNV